VPACNWVLSVLSLKKDAKKCEEEWETLSTHLATRIELVQEQLAEKQEILGLGKVVNDYKE
jgi:hypothetical protein